MTDARYSPCCTPESGSLAPSPVSFGNAAPSAHRPSPIPAQRQEPQVNFIALFSSLIIACTPPGLFCGLPGAIAGAITSAATSAATGTYTAISFAASTTVSMTGFATIPAHNPNAPEPHLEPLPPHDESFFMEMVGLLGFPQTNTNLYQNVATAYAEAHKRNRLYGFGIQSFSDQTPTGLFGAPTTAFSANQHVLDAYNNYKLALQQVEFCIRTSAEALSYSYSKNSVPYSLTGTEEEAYAATHCLSQAMLKLLGSYNIWQTAAQAFFLSYSKELLPLHDASSDPSTQPELQPQPELQSEPQPQPPSSPNM